MSLALWNDADDMTMERRNVEALGVRLGIPFRDRAQGGSLTVPPVSAIVKLGTTIGDVWAVPATIGGVSITVALVTSITLLNKHTAAQAVNLYMIEPGQTAASVARSIFVDTMDVNESFTIRVPFILNTGATIRGFAGTQADTVAVRVNALAFTAQPYGTTLKIVEGVALTDALQTIYTCPGGITQAIILAMGMCNTHTADVQPEVYIVPNGGAAAVENQVFNDTLVTKESAWIEGIDTMVTGDFIRAKASVTSVVGFRPTILEIL